MTRAQSSSRFTIIHICLAILLIVILLFILYRFLRGNHQVEMTRADEGKVSWNVLFKNGTNKNSRDAAIAAIKDYVKTSYDDYNSAHGTTYAASLEEVNFCPCDTLLYNYDFTVIDGSGKSVTTAPSQPPPKRLGGSGDNIDIIANNIVIAEPQRDTTEIPILVKVLKKGYMFNTEAMTVRNIPVDPSKKLAIIDSGIDTTLFTAPINDLIWADNPTIPTIHNFLPGQSAAGFQDETRVKHGSAVAAIIIKAIDNTPVYPKLMILKALDKNNRGSAFSVSCALSYAIQKHAALINLSLGYYGAADSVLMHYIELSNTNKPAIEIFAAAGNTRGAHNGDLCQQPPDSSLLSQSRLFYPACFSQDFKNITSVTQTGNKHAPCFFQNYSNQFIKLAVYDKSNCCAIQVNFKGLTSNYYEGSSFATPVASGLRMGTMLQPLALVSPVMQWNALLKTEPLLNKVTAGGKYVEYISKK